MFMLRAPHTIHTSLLMDLAAAVMRPYNARQMFTLLVSAGLIGRYDNPQYVQASDSWDDG